MARWQYLGLVEPIISIIPGLAPGIDKWDTSKTELPVVKKVLTAAVLATTMAFSAPILPPDFVFKSPTVSVHQPSRLVTPLNTGTIFTCSPVPISNPQPGVSEFQPNRIVLHKPILYQDGDITSPVPQSNLQPYVSEYFPDRVLKFVRSGQSWSVPLTVYPNTPFPDITVYQPSRIVNQPFINSIVGTVSPVTTSFDPSLFPLVTSFQPSRIVKQFAEVITSLVILPNLNQYESASADVLQSFGNLRSWQYKSLVEPILPIPGTAYDASLFPYIVQHQPDRRLRWTANSLYASILVPIYNSGLFPVTSQTVQFGIKRNTWFDGAKSVTSPISNVQPDVVNLQPTLPPKNNNRYIYHSYNPTVLVPLVPDVTVVQPSRLVQNTNRSLSLFSINTNPLVPQILSDSGLLPVAKRSSRIGDSAYPTYFVPPIVTFVPIPSVTNIQPDRAIRTNLLFIHRIDPITGALSFITVHYTNKVNSRGGETLIGTAGGDNIRTFTIRVRGGRSAINVDNKG